MYISFFKFNYKWQSLVRGIFTKIDNVLCNKTVFNQIPVLNPNFWVHQQKLHPKSRRPYRKTYCRNP